MDRHGGILNLPVHWHRDRATSTGTLQHIVLCTYGAEDSETRGGMDCKEIYFEEWAKVTLRCRIFELYVK